ARVPIRRRPRWLSAGSAERRLDANRSRSPLRGRSSVVVLDVDDHAWRALEHDHARTGIRGEAQVPRALALAGATLDRVDQRRLAGIEIGRAVVAARAGIGLLRAAAHPEDQEAVALHVDRRARRVPGEGWRGAAERQLRRPL